MDKKIMDYQKKTDNPYQLKVGEMQVKMKYSQNNKKFNQCLLNILKLKSS